MNGLTPGRVVHFVWKGGDQNGVHKAAVITFVYPHPAERPVVDLILLGRNGIMFPEAIPHDPDGAPDTWHWIEGSPGSADKVKENDANLSMLANQNTQQEATIAVLTDRLMTTQARVLDLTEQLAALEQRLDDTNRQITEDGRTTDRLKNHVIPQLERDLRNTVTGLIGRIKDLEPRLSGG